jgi:4-hydroxy-tetrahydrodipicolinate synthase
MTSKGTYVEQVGGAGAKDWAFRNIKGLWVSMLGPIKGNDELDEEGVRKGVQRALQLDIGGLSYSSLFEYWGSTHEERRRGCEILLDEVAGRKPVYVNITDHSIKETVGFGEHAIKHGAAILLLQVPFEHTKSEAHIFDFFRYVCERLDAPIALYNTPHASLELSVDLINRLADIDNICALKNGYFNNEHSDECFKVVGDRMVVSHAIESQYLRHIKKNNQQALFATTSTHIMQTPDWQPIAEYQRLGWAGDFEAAERVAAEIQPLRELWDNIYRAVLERNEHPIAYMKYWQDLMGIPAGPPRPPLRPLTTEQKTMLSDWIVGSGLVEKLGMAERIYETA